MILAVASRFTSRNPMLNLVADSRTHEIVSVEIIDCSLGGTPKQI
jgi:hypothetical protein